MGTLIILAMVGVPLTRKVKINTYKSLIHNEQGITPKLLESV